MKARKKEQGRHRQEKYRLAHSQPPTGLTQDEMKEKLITLCNPKRDWEDLYPYVICLKPEICCPNDTWQDWRFVLHKLWPMGHPEPFPAEDVMIDPVIFEALLVQLRQRNRSRSARERQRRHRRWFNGRVRSHTIRPKQRRAKASKTYNWKGFEIEWPPAPDVLESLQLYPELNYTRWEKILGRDALDKTLADHPEIKVKPRQIDLFENEPLAPESHPQ
jgi:hypothetical protein